MSHGRLQTKIVGGVIAGGLVAFFALSLEGCPNTAGDCHYTLSCEPPSCAEAGDVEGCIPDDTGEDGGKDAQAD
jgi:hypothetical protein